MSVDTVNYALTRIRLRVAYDQSNAFSVEGKNKLIYMMGCMRSYLMLEDIDGFDRYVDNALGSSPDAMDWILEELFEQLGCKSREDLSTQLAEV